MKKLFYVGFAFLLVTFAATITFAQESPTQDKASAQAGQGSLAPADTKIPRNSKVYIAPMEGFETYLAAAFRKKGVPLVIVTEPEYADFSISGTHDKKNAGWAKTIFLGDGRSSASASMQVVNMRTKVVVFADSSHRGSANRGERSTAEKLAKYLKKKIEDDEKSVR
jgi:hypothetical protein